MTIIRDFMFHEKNMAELTPVCQIRNEKQIMQSKQLCNYADDNLY